MTSTRKPTAGFWISVALAVALVAYPLSFGPAMWIMAWLLKAGQIGEGGQVCFLLFYYPLVCAVERGGTVGAVLGWYAHLFG